MQGHPLKPLLTFVGVGYDLLLVCALINVANYAAVFMYTGIDYNSRFKIRFAVGVGSIDCSMASSSIINQALSIVYGL